MKESSTEPWAEGSIAHCDNTDFKDHTCGIHRCLGCELMGHLVFCHVKTLS